MPLRISMHAKHIFPEICFATRRLGLAGEPEDVGYSSWRIGRELMRGSFEKALRYLCIGRRVIGGRRVDEGNR